MEPSSTNNNKTLAKLAVIIAIVIIAVGVKAFTSKKTDKDITPAYATSTKSSSAPTNSSSTSTSTPTTGTSTTSTSAYKDGSYTATGQYESPGGSESITISVTLKNGNISNTSATSGANDPDAKQFQSDFISGYKSQVVGKSIDSVNLSRVSGSSLTSQGFNEAIDKIRTQAKA